MLEKINLKKLKEKRRNVRLRLEELNYLPKDQNDYTQEHHDIVKQLENLDFTFWEKVKIKHGWVERKKLSEDERKLSDRRKRARNWFRDNGYLPEYGQPLSENQQKIVDQLEINDFTFFEECKEKKISEILESNSKKSKEVKNGTLKIKESPNTNEKKDLRKMEGYTAVSEPKHVLHRLRMTQILPPLNHEVTEEQQNIIDDVNENWFGKPKNYFVKKYIHLSTPEGRLYYRLYLSHREKGFRFTITVDDIKIPEFCPYLNIPISTDPKDKDKDNYYTGDRKDSSKGITPENLEVISLKANRMKNKATEIELMKFATNGLNLLKDV